MSTRAVSKEQEEEQETLPASETRVGPGSGRWNVAAMPVEKSTQFRASIRRLASLLRPERPMLIVVGVAAVVGAGLNVAGPRVLGHGTDVIFRGVTTHRGILFGQLHRILMEAAALHDQNVDASGSDPESPHLADGERSTVGT